MDKPAKILIRNGRVIDPASGTDETLDILLADGRIAALGTSVETAADKVIDASRLVVVPGLIDMHVHLREPGAENKETIASGSRAAARGGFTTVCAMPNTRPVNDNRKVTSRILEEAARSAIVNVLPIAAVTLGSKGEELTDMAALAQAGAAAFSDDGSPVSSSRVMRLALEKAQSLGRLVIDHCEDKALSRDGVMNAGKVSSRLGLKGIPAAAEDIIVARDIILARDLGAPVHIAHLSTKGAAQALKAAKDLGVRVSAEATPHHLLLSDEAVDPGNADFKMNPPLRGREDVEALVAALKAGTIDVIATDHAPHTEQDKARGFEKAPFGIVGLETAVSLVLDRLVHKGVIGLPRFAELLSLNPAKLLGLRSKGHISEGADADLTLLSLSKDVVVDRSAFESKSRNTPFHGWKLKGQAVMTIVGGRVVYPFEPGKAV